MESLKWVVLVPLGALLLCAVVAGVYMVAGVVWETAKGVGRFVRGGWRELSRGSR